MFPVLYKKDETDFIHNGLGVLSGAITAVPDEELNGPFEITIEYDSEGFLADKIENGMIVKAKANDRQDPQLFRIYAIEKSLQSDNLIIHGQHITYDLAGNFVESLVLKNYTLKEAMEAIKKNLAYPTRFNITSTNNETVSSTSLYRTNPLQMIAGMEGSILQIWGGQIERDNFNLIMHKRRGSDDGVLVTYKKNLTGLEAKFDESQVVTRIFPFKYDEETDTLITIDGKYIDSPNINKYPVIKILPVDFSDDESIKNKTDLYNASKNFFNVGGKDLPTVEMEVEFEPLHGTEEYKDVAVLELVGMGDTITVRHSKMGIDVKAQVVQIEYDSIAEKNKKVTLGNVKARLTDTINNAADIINNVGERINNANEKANEAIRAANGKNTIFYGPDEPTGAQEGDIWFKTVDGEYTRTYRFDGVQWQLVVSADIRDIEEEAQEARNRADEAVEKANLATNNANEAIEQAQEAFDEATSAHNIADAAREASEAAGRVAGEAKEQAGTAIADAQKAMSEAQTALKDVDDLETSITAEFETINGQLKSKVSQTEFNGLKGTVTNHSTLIQQTQNDIKSKADKNYVDTIKGTVDSHSTLISQNAEEIKSKASQSAVNTLTGQVESHESLISQNAKEIAQRMRTVDANAKFATQSQLTQTSSSLTSQITAVRTNLDNLEIGGRNLLKNSRNPSVIPFDWVTKSAVVEFDSEFGENVYVINKATAGELTAGTERVIVEPDTEYTLSAYLKQTSNVVSIDYYFLSRRKGSTSNYDFVTSRTNFKVTGEWTRITWTFKTPAEAYEGYVRFDNNGSTNGQNSKLSFTKFKLEKGNKATDWTPAPEDMVTAVQFSTLEQTVDSITTRVGNSEGNISSLQQTANSLSSRISSAEGNISTLTQTAQGLQTQVTDNKGNISSVTQLANSLQTRMTNAEGGISTLTQTATSLQSTISSVRNDLDNLEIGGRNFLTDSSANGVYPKLNGYYSAGRSTAQPLDGYIRLVCTDHSDAYYQMGETAQKMNGFNAGDAVTFSGEFDNDIENADVTFYCYIGGTWRESRYTINKNGWGNRFSATFIIPKDTTGIMVRIRFPRVVESVGKSIRFRKIKLEKGNKATDWTPAPEDMATQSQISQLSDAINLRVTKKDLINQINIDTSGILISGKKLVLDGNTTVTGTFKVNNANIVSVDAGKMTTGTLDAGKVSVINLNASNIKSGKINANSVTISATNGLAKLDLSSTGLQSYDSSGKMRIALNIRSAGGAGSDPATLRFFSGNGSISAGVGMNVNDTFVIGSTSNSVHNEIYSGGNTIMYANQIRMVTKEGTGGYSKRYFIMNSLKSATGDYNPCLYPDTSGWGYVGTTANRLWRIYTNYLHYVDLVNLSTRDSKANIQEANIKQMQSAFDDMDLVTFNYKNEDGSPRDELKIGWIAEESPSLITSKDKKQISLNNTVGVMAGSMKYQQQRIDQLEKEKEELILKVAKLEERLHKLEAA
ncbi:phage tail spike protein [Siminovitchia fortis]|uniref:phage tail spike protein n=1 Tax=Siminovitchia fortis TaxID=254758 RepID=UPI0011A0BA58|nr:phage tail spike protein [Siminovitchia fortis]